MDLRALRTQLAQVGQTCGLNTWDYMPDDPQNLPALVIEGFSAMTRLNAIVTELDLEVVFYVNNAEAKDAAARLDGLFSVGVDPGVSFIDALDAFTEGNPADTGAYWRSVRFKSAGPSRRYAMPGDGTVALGCPAVWTFTA